VAVQRMTGYGARGRGARVGWPSSWETAFDKAMVGAVRSMLWSHVGDVDQTA